MNTLLFSKTILKIKVILSGNKLYVHTKKAIKKTNTLSFDQYHLIFCDTNDIKNETIEKMIGSATTYHQWKTIYGCVVSDDKYESLALKRMFEVAETVDQFLEIYTIDSDDYLGSCSFKRIEEKLITFDNWLHFYDKVRTNRVISVIVLHKMIQMASNYKEANLICIRAGIGSQLETESIQLMMKYAVTYNDWKTIFDRTIHSDALHKNAIEKLQQITNAPHDDKILSQLVDKTIFTDLNHKNAVADHTNYDQ